MKSAAYLGSRLGTKIENTIHQFINSLKTTITEQETITEMATYNNHEAAQYDQVINQPVYRFYVHKKINLIKIWLKKKSILLDVGCGTGEYTTALAKQCETVVGIDVSPKMLAQGISKAQQKGLSNISFVIGDATHLPFRDSTFDLALSVNVLHHIYLEKTISAMLLEMARACKKKGHILVFELNPNSLGWSKDFIPRIIRKLVYLLLFPFHEHTIDHIEKGTKMVNVPELLNKTERIKVILIKVGGFIPTYCPKFLFAIFVSLEKAIEATPLLRRYGAHVLTVGEVQ